LGLATNLGFLARIVADPDFAAGKLDTGFIERRREALLPGARPASDIALAAAAVSRLVAATTASAADADPWSRRDGWRLNTAPAPQRLSFRDGEQAHEIEATAVADGWRLRIGERDYQAAAERLSDGRLALSLDGARFAAAVLEHDARLAVFIAGESWEFDELDPLAPPQGAETGSGRLTAPMPGRVIELLVAPGAAVRKGQPMMVIEAMKMEHTIAAPRDGVVAAINFAAGDLVEEGAELIALAEADAIAG
jgi:3-methylcrotonyl-CoA carboxylase alpha subunit